jgi:hypothetical protein
VALFRAQVDLLRAVDPTGDGTFFRDVSIGNYLRYYDELLARGDAAPWPKGVLSGLKQGIRFAQTMLDMAYSGPQRVELRRQLRAASGDAVEVLETRDSQRLAAVRRRGRIRNEDEYYLVVATIDRMEAQNVPDQELLSELRGLADSAQTS